MKKTLFLIFGAMLLFAPLSFAASGKATVLRISTKGDQLVFDKASLSAKAGQPIKLIFKNGASKSSGLQHNWVLVKPGTADQVAAASISAGVEKGWLAESLDVVAHTKLVNAGESETLQFVAPTEPGDYQYFCSFPGHAQTMKGVLHIKKFTN